MDKLQSRKKRRHTPDQYALWILLAPAFIYAALFFYGPMYGLQIAFRNYLPNLGIWDSAWVGLRWFEKTITYYQLWEMIRNTLYITVYNLLLFPLPIIVAVLLNEVRSTRFKKTIQMISYMPHFLSTVVMCGMVLLFLDLNSGLFNSIRALLGKEPVYYMGIGRLFPHIYIWSGVWQEIGWSMIIYVAALAGVSMETVEAAIVDGANRVQIIRHVNIPAILPTIIITFILNTGHLLSIGFDKVYLLQTDLNLDYSMVIATYTYRVGMNEAQYSYSSAIGLFNTVVNLLLLVMVNAVSKRSSGISVI